MRWPSTKRAVARRGDVRKGHSLRSFRILEQPKIIAFIDTSVGAHELMVDRRRRNVLGVVGISRQQL